MNRLPLRLSTVALAALLMATCPAAASAQVKPDVLDQAKKLLEAEKFKPLARLLADPRVRAKHPRLPYLYAWARLELTDRGEIRSAQCRPALEKLSPSAFARNALGWLEFRAGRYLGAARHFQQAEARAPLNETIINNWIEALHKYEVAHRGKRPQPYRDSLARLGQRDLKLEGTRAAEGLRRLGVRWVTDEQYQRREEMRSRRRALYEQSRAAARSSEARLFQAKRRREEIARLRLRDEHVEPYERAEISELRRAADEAERDGTRLRREAENLRAEADSLKAQLEVQGWTGQSDVFLRDLFEQAIREGQERAVEQARAELAQADALLKEFKYAAAAAAYESLAALHGGTPAADSASARLRQMRSDPQIARAIERAKADKQAKNKDKRADTLLRMARLFVRNEKLAAAREYYERILEHYPQTAAAAAAKTELAELPKPEGEKKP